MKNKKKETNAMKRCARKLTAGLLAGAMVLSTPVIASAGSWRHNTRGWWWYNDDWSYPTNSWKTIYGKDYHFNSQGYMDTYWARVDGNYYWFGRANDGAKKTYWQNIWGRWYWLGSDGAMRTGFQNVWGKTYYLGGENDGAMKTGWLRIPAANGYEGDDQIYYLGSDGVVRKGWQTIGGKRYHFYDEDGMMSRGQFETIDGKDYYFNDDGTVATYWFKNKKGTYWLFGGADGVIRTGWQNIWGKKYYFESGYMLTGWREIDGDWYYFGGKNDGSLKTNTWVGKYWVDADGKWDKSKHNHEWTEKDEVIEHPEEGHYEDVLVSPEEGHTETVHHEEEGHYEDVVHPEESHIEIVHHDAVTHTVDHPEEWHMETVTHPAETHTVEHPEEYHYEKMAYWDEEANMWKPDLKADYDDIRTFCWKCGADMGKTQDTIHAHLVYHTKLGEAIRYSDYPAKKVIDKEAWTETIVDREEWSEEVKVVDREAYTETVVDSEAYDEEVKVVDKEEWTEKNVYIVDKEAYDEDVYVVDKEAVYESQYIVDKEAYTETVSKTVCSICGVEKDK